MLNKFGLPQHVFDEIVAAIKKYPEIKSAKIFGSRAKGDFSRYSDVDIAVFADCIRDLSADIRYDLEDLNIIYNCDILHYEKVVNSEIKSHIDRVGIEILDLQGE